MAGAALSERRVNVQQGPQTLNRREAMGRLAKVGLVLAVPASVAALGSAQEVSAQNTRTIDAVKGIGADKWAGDAAGEDGAAENFEYVVDAYANHEAKSVHITTPHSTDRRLLDNHHGFLSRIHDGGLSVIHEGRVPGSRRLKSTENDWGTTDQIGSADEYLERLEDVWGDEEYVSAYRDGDMVAPFQNVNKMPFSLNNQQRREFTFRGLDIIRKGAERFGRKIQAFASMNQDLALRTLKSEPNCS